MMRFVDSIAADLFANVPPCSKEQHEWFGFIGVACKKCGRVPLTDDEFESGPLQPPGEPGV